MKQIPIQDVILYIRLWTVAVIVYLSAFAFHLWRLKKRNPWIFGPDTTADDPQWLGQQGELRRQINNKIMWSFAVVIFWMAGVMILCSSCVSVGQAGVFWGLILFLVFFTVSNIMRKPKD